MQNRTSNRHQSVARGQSLQPADSPLAFRGQTSSLLRVAQTIAPRLALLARSVPDYQRSELQSRFDLPRCGRIDYDVYAEAFADGYFLRNFWKAAVALLQDGAEYRPRIVDLGCGPGSMAIAYLAYLDDLLPPGNHTAEVTLVDKSRRQLQLAKDLLYHTAHALRKVRPVVKTIHVDLLDWTLTEPAECVFLGHVLTENPDSVGPIVSKVLRGLQRDGRVFIIERPDDIIWTDIDERVRDLSLPRCAAVTQTEPIFQSKYIKVSAPHRLQLRDLLVKYFDAWRAQSTDLIADLFADSACYAEKPFDPPLHGLEQIKQYWRENVLPQRHLEVNIAQVVYSDDEVFAEWNASFIDKHARPRRVSGTLTLSPTTDLNKILLLREHFISDTKSQ